MRKWNWLVELYLMEIDDEGAERDGSEARGGICDPGFCCVLVCFLKHFLSERKKQGGIGRCTRSCND